MREEFVQCARTDKNIYNESCHLNADRVVGNSEISTTPWTCDLRRQQLHNGQNCNVPFNSLHQNVHFSLPGLHTFMTFEPETYVCISWRVVLLFITTYIFINIWNLYGIYSLLFTLLHLKWGYFLSKYSLWTYLMLIWKELFLLTSKPPDQIQLGTSIIRTHNSWS